MLSQVLQKQDEQIDALNQHSKLINQQSGTLNTHTEMLQAQTALLKDHHQILSQHSELFQGHTELLQTLVTEVKGLRSDLNQFHDHEERIRKIEEVLFRRGA